MNILRPRVIWGFIKKEAKQIRRDPKMIVAMFFLPVMQSVLFGLALTSEVKNISFVVIGKPGAVSREITARALAGGWFKEVKNIDPNSVLNPADLIISRTAEAVLVLPKEGAEEALERGGKPLQLLINATNATRAQQVEGYVKSIIGQVFARRAGGAQGGLIELDMRVMFNHYMSTPYFMIPAIMAMSAYIVLLIVCSMAICKEKEMGTMEKLISSPASTLEILLGKTIPYFVVGLVIVFFIMTIGVGGFGVPFRGHLWQLLLTATLFVISALGVAVLVSTFANNQQQAMMGCFLYLLPTVLLSGVFFPIENIPSWARVFSYMTPMMYSVVNYRDLMLKGGDMAHFMQFSAILFVFGVTLAAVSYKNFKSKLN